jgi:uncharacterized protein YutE (UPF0331/DUF86 family)/predicted nucleotidyltransferase
MKDTRKIKALKEYFKNKPEVTMAYLFGSQMEGRTSIHSDWDVAVYFKPQSNYVEWEENKFYPDEDIMLRDLEKMLKNEIDLVVLNRAPSALVFSILAKGTALAINDRKTYLGLLEKSSYEAIDFREFCRDFYKIKQRSQSLSEDDKAELLQILDFLETEARDFARYKNLTWQVYQKERPKRREAERWIENIVNASLDITKIILASEKKDMPSTYQETLRLLGTTSIFDMAFADRFSQWAKLRNILAHRYLDIKWEQIHRFIQSAPKDISYFVEKIKTHL